MADERSSKIWSEILEVLDKKLQLALLDKAQQVVDVEIEGPELRLTVCDADAADFFNADVNQQRLILQVRSVINLEKISAVTVEASAIKR